ncbi:SagB family peptide dehydrogenase [Streptomyces sp. NPDC001568]|uniref:SagB family peptide dehydrogenase n=1 Tax=Streptomyces sp. NPDC001568 TaxID=3364588 RepID=UPI00367DAED5
MTATETVAVGEELLSLRSGVHRTEDAGGTHHLVAWPRVRRLGPLDPDLLSVLDLLARRPVLRSELTDRSAGDASGRPGPVARLLDLLLADGWLRRTTCAGNGPLWTLCPAGTPLPEATTARPVEAVLSRFAVLRHDGSDLLLESPRSSCTVRVHPLGRSALSGVFAADGASGPLADALWKHGFLVADGRNPEEDELRLRQWSPHELWFHTRSRLGGRTDSEDGFGGTWWSRGEFDEPSERHGPFPGPRLPLHRPDLNALRVSDQPLTAVLEGRRSLRTHDDTAPLSAEQLGEFLYRCAAVREPSEPDGAPSRPYPAGGARYELEIYPVVRQVKGLSAGMYHYDPFDHQLTLVSDPGPEVRRMLGTAARMGGMEQPPQVLLVISARFGRTMAKYESMAYALTLKHVGVLTHVMYAVATSMGLAPCALGSGDSEAFTAASGLDAFTESSVGEFLLGSREVTGA